MRHTKRKLVYWGTYGVSLAAVLAVIWGVTRPEPGHGWSPTFAIYMLSIWAWGAWMWATLLCRRLRVSLDATHSEAIWAADAVRVAVAPSGVGPTRWQTARKLATAFAGAAVAGVGLWAANVHLGSPRALMIGAWTTCLVAAVGLFRTRYAAGKSVATVDATGVTRGAVLGRGTWHIPWSRIGRCEVRTQCDALGRPCGTALVLRDHDGKQITEIDLTREPEESRRRFLEAVRGEPAPTELLAAEAPAGRGTELASAAEAVPPVPVAPGREPAQTGREMAR